MTSCISELNLLLAEDSGTGTLLQDERRAALADLLGNSHFQPRNDNCGPYALQISIEEGRLILRMRNARQEELNMLVLSLKPYRRMIQDYFLILESYENARHHATREKLEAIDMARRALHNEGAELLIGRMTEKIDMDFDTARRLFTLICVLHRGNARMMA